MPLSAAVTPRPLDDQDLRRWRACARRHWLHRQGVAAVLVTRPAESTREADAALRSAFPGALRVAAPRDEADWPRALAETRAALDTLQVGGPLASAAGDAVLGACLMSDDGARTRIDVMQRGEHGWRLFRLRVGTVADDADVDALAFAAHVAARAGWRLQSAGLLLIDSDFLYPGLGCYAGLFREVDAGPMLGSRPVADWLVALRRGEAGPEPAMTMTAPCTRDGGCELVARCHAGEPAPAAVDPREALEIVGRELAESLRVEGFRHLREVPLARLQDARHRRAWQAVQRGAAVVEPEAAARVQAWPRPWRLLRIETIGMAVPAWSGTRPYEVIPFQWTCRVEPATGAPWTDSFIADGLADPRRALAESLLQALAEPVGEGPGTLLAYNAGFERNRLRELARRFDDLAPALEAAADRLVDVFQFARQHIYHPEQAGSWSAKAIFRAVAPELGAHRFDAEGCRTPLQAFGRSLQAASDAALQQRLRNALQAHGERQTAALGRLIQCLQQGDIAPDAAPTT